MRIRKSVFRQSLTPIAAGVIMALGASAAHAFQFKLDNGVEGSFDTTISYGIAIRTKNPDGNLIGLANGGNSRSVNEDDGNIFYRKNDVYSSVLKATHDAEVRYGRFGAFMRGTYFYDFENHDNPNLGPEGRKRIGRDAKILDAYVSGSFNLLPSAPLRVRVGQQVVSWGESTFIPNGINVINPVDISKLRIPGSELKEAFIPSKMLWISQELSKSASVEGFVLANFDKIKLDPRGSYFSNNDFASDDSWKVFVGFGRRKDNRTPLTNPALFSPAQLAASPAIAQLNRATIGLLGNPDAAAAIWAPRSSDRDPKDTGQYGLAFRYLASELNNTEFGLYHINYHSRIPLFSGIKGTPTSALTGTAVLASYCSNAALSSLCHTGSATYFAEYPENIKLYGVSFNTAGPAGIAIQGEYSYRPNLPLQYSTPELLLAALGAPNLISGFTQIPGAPAGATAAALVPNGTYQRGWERVKASQFQVTGTKAFPNVLGAEQAVLVGEFGYTKYHNLNNTVKFNGPAVYLPATALGAVASGANALQEDGFTTSASYGYRLVGRAEYPSVFMGVNVAPRVAFSHDLKGVSQTFNEGVRSLSLGTSFDYQKKLLVDVSYTMYGGGRTYCGTDVPATAQSSVAGQPVSFCSSANPIKDRDFVSLSISYSF
jgi:hypothetical protein